MGVIAIILTVPLAYGIYSAFSYGASSWLRKLVGKVAQQFIVGAMHGLSLAILPCIVWQKWGLLTLSVVVPSVTLGLLGCIFDQDAPAPFKEAVTGMNEYLFPLFVV